MVNFYSSNYMCGVREDLFLTLVFVVLAFFTGCSSHKPAEKSFESDLWITRVDVRHEMVDGIIQSRKFIGMSSDLIKKSLGAPDLQEGSVLYYTLDHSRYGAFDSAYLAVVIDGGGKAQQLKIVLN